MKLQALSLWNADAASLGNTLQTLNAVQECSVYCTEQ